VGWKSSVEGGAGVVVSGLVVHPHPPKFPLEGGLFRRGTFGGELLGGGVFGAVGDGVAGLDNGDVADLHPFVAGAHASVFCWAVRVIC
jgi:hypothetical protein